MPGAVLSIHEYIITFDREISIVWRRKWSFMSIVLLSTRWVMLVNAITTFLPAHSVQVRRWRAMQNLVLTDVFLYLRKCQR